MAMFSDNRLLSAWLRVGSLSVGWSQRVDPYTLKRRCCDKSSLFPGITNGFRLFPVFPLIQTQNYDSVLLFYCTLWCVSCQSPTSTITFVKWYNLVFEKINLEDAVLHLSRKPPRFCLSTPGICIYVCLSFNLPSPLSLPAPLAQTYRTY